MGNIVAVTMPKWGMEMTEGTINEWHSQEGDEVTAGVELIDVETSKIVNTVEAAATGLLRKQIAQPGDVFPCGALLAVIADDGVSDAEIETYIDGFEIEAAGAQVATGGGKGGAKSPAKPEAKPAVKAQVTAAPKRATKTEVTLTAVSGALSEGPDDRGVAASSIARRLAKKLNVNLNNVEGTGKNGRISKEDVEAAVAKASEPAPQATSSAKDDADIPATPVARRLAKKHGISLADITPTGTKGRVSKEDVEAKIAESSPAEVTAAAPAPAVAPATQTASPTENDFIAKPLNGMRRTIAQRLSESKQTAPHFRLTVDINIDPLLKARKQINESREDIKVSVNDFVIKGCAQALVANPDVNVQFVDNEIRAFANADISVAVALDGGLITPVLRAANQKSLTQVAIEAKDLAERAKSGQLSLDEFQGGTFSISNLGMFGIRQFDAVINLPQAAILAVSAGEQRPVVIDGELAVATMMTVSLSCDHRAIDGALGAKFLADLKSKLENPITMLA